METTDTSVITPITPPGGLAPGESNPQTIADLTA